MTGGFLYSRFFNGHARREGGQGQGQGQGAPKKNSSGNGKGSKDAANAKPKEVAKESSATPKKRPATTAAIGDLD